MDFKDIIKQLSERVDKLKDNLQTEEATKNALIMPFLQALGYDVFNPYEVMPEFTCDIGTKKGEKIDYAIMKDGKPIILIECKTCNEDLTLHDNQLLRYFHVSEAKFGILTNGVRYRFYTDLENKNKMDEKPFLEVNLLDLRDAHIEELKKFHKSYFDIENILSSASELKYMGELKHVLISEFGSPSPEFTKLLTRQVYDYPITAKVLEQFTALVKRSIANHINDAITERLKSAIQTTQEKGDAPQEAIEAIIQQLPEGVVNISEDGKIITTQEEIEAFYIVRSILRPHISCERITYRDFQNWFSILVDDTQRRIICKLYLSNPENKRISFYGDDNKEVKHQIQSLDDIYNFSEQVIEAGKKFV